MILICFDKLRQYVCMDAQDLGIDLASLPCVERILTFRPSL